MSTRSKPDLILFGSAHQQVVGQLALLKVWRKHKRSDRMFLHSQHWESQRLHPKYGISASIPLSSIRNLLTILFHLRDGFLRFSSLCRCLLTLAEISCVKCMVLSWLWLSLCSTVWQVWFCPIQTQVANQWCCPASEPPWMLSPQRQHPLPSSLQCIWWNHSEPGNGEEVPEIAKIAKFQGGASKIQNKHQKPLVSTESNKSCLAAWKRGKFHLAGVFFCISAKRVISWKPGISGCKTVRISYIVKQSHLVSCLLQ